MTLCSNVIVVGVDGTGAGDRTAWTAVGLAHALGCHLHVVRTRRHCDDDRAWDGGAGRDALGDLLRPLVDELRAVHPAVTTAAPAGRPDEALINEATRLRARLIVVGDGHAKGADRAFGSVASVIVRRAPCDTYVAHST